MNNQNFEYVNENDNEEGLNITEEEAMRRLQEVVDGVNYASSIQYPDGYFSLDEKSMMGYNYLCAINTIVLNRDFTPKSFPVVPTGLGASLSLIRHLEVLNDVENYDEFVAGCTGLLRAKQFNYGFEDIIRQLMQKGAVPNIKDKSISSRIYLGTSTSTVKYFCDTECSLRSYYTIDGVPGPRITSRDVDRIVLASWLIRNNPKDYICKELQMNFKFAATKKYWSNNSVSMPTCSSVCDKIKAINALVNSVWDGTMIVGQTHMNYVSIKKLMTAKIYEKINNFIAVGGTENPGKKILELFREIRKGTINDMKGFKASAPYFNADGCRYEPVCIKHQFKNSDRKLIDLPSLVAYVGVTKDGPNGGLRELMSNYPKTKFDLYDKEGSSFQTGDGAIIDVKSLNIMTQNAWSVLSGYSCVIMDTYEKTGQWDLVNYNFVINLFNIVKMEKVIFKDSMFNVREFPKLKFTIVSRGNKWNGEIMNMVERCGDNEVVTSYLKVSEYIDFVDANFARGGPRVFMSKFKHVPVHRQPITEYVKPVDLGSYVGPDKFGTVSNIMGMYHGFKDLKVIKGKEGDAYAIYCDYACDVQGNKIAPVDKTTFVKNVINHMAINENFAPKPIFSPPIAGVNPIDLQLHRRIPVHVQMKEESHPNSVTPYIPLVNPVIPKGMKLEITHHGRTAEYYISTDDYKRIQARDFDSYYPAKYKEITDNGFEKTDARYNANVEKLVPNPKYFDRVIANGDSVLISSRTPHNVGGKNHPTYGFVQYNDGIVQMDDWSKVESDANTKRMNGKLLTLQEGEVLYSLHMMNKLGLEFHPENDEE
jgi:hypothetical protein